MRRCIILAALVAAFFVALVPIQAQARRGHGHGHGHCHTARCFRHAAELCKTHPACRARVARKQAARAAAYARSHPAVAGVPPESWAECESGGDPRAVSPGGTYRGKWQFAMSTWLAYGGRGDPIDAPEAVQDAVAARVYAAQGAGAWPVCSHSG